MTFDDMHLLPLPNGAEFVDVVEMWTEGDKHYAVTDYHPSIRRSGFHLLHGVLTWEPSG